MSDSIKRVSMDELEHRAATLRRTEAGDEANAVMAYIELGRMLEVNVERALVLIQAEQRLERLEHLCSGLQSDRIQMSAELAALRSDHAALSRMQDAHRARLDVVAAVMDVGIAKIEELARKFGDLPEP